MRDKYAEQAIAFAAAFVLIGYFSAHALGLI